MSLHARIGCWVRSICGPLIFLVLGLLTGLAWLASLQPVAVTGPLIYDLSRWVFAVAILAALAALLYRPAREYGLAVCLSGVLLGIAGGAYTEPIQLTRRVVVFSFLLGAAMLPSLVCCLAIHRAAARARRRDQAPAKPVSAPRKFGTKTLLIGMLALAALLAVSKGLDMPPAATAWIGCLILLIAAGQVVTGEQPRCASILIGALFVPLTVAATWSATGANSHPFFSSLVAMPADVAFFAAHLTALGAVCGYLAGVLVAGLFLVIELVGSRSQVSATS